MHMSNTFDKLSVLVSFIEEVNSYLPEIETNLERLEQSPDDIAALEETYRCTHTIGGSASMMDFPGLAHVAHGMEDVLGDVLDGLATLDSPTLELLRRSLGRVHRLVVGIRDGIDENAVIAEDDADYARYRAMVESSAEPEQGQEVEVGANGTPEAAVASSPSSSESAIPSLDEVLASFKSPSAATDDEVAWPEEPIPVSHSEVHADQDDLLETPTAPQKAVQPSALEVLVATTRQLSLPGTPPVTPLTPADHVDEPVPTLAQDSPALQVPESLESSQSVDQAPQGTLSGPSSSPGRGASSSPGGAGQHHVLDKSITSAPERVLYAGAGNIALPKPYTDMQEEAQALEAQASSLKNTLAQLRQAVTVIETQRAEFKGFLDGSKDALERMEDWAGKAMGLNLRNSPEQVRRYLPLSVMWAANSKLKKVLDLLTHITSGVEMTDEQLSTALQQLHISIDACGTAFQRLQADSSTHSHRPDAGWSPWEVEVAREAEAMRERVIFERRGDPVALRAEIEAQVREELRREYESRSPSLAARADLERQIREEVRREFEAKRQLQERIAGSGRGIDETLSEMEIRLRNEIEIQVRRDFLDQLMAGVDLTSVVPQVLDASAPPAPNVTGQVRGTTPPPVPAPPVRSSAPPTTAFGGDFGEEATEIFRLEAEEHLQTISVHMAALEKSPGDRDIVQGIRRATHTLKGAAGMMGFRAIADLCHVSEDLLDSVMEGKTSISPIVLSLLLDTAEALDLLINNKGIDQRDAELTVQTLRTRYIEMLGEQSTSSLSVEEEIDADFEDSHVVGILSGTQATETKAQRATRRDLSVRVRLQKLDELVNLFGELLVNRSVLEERIERLVRLVSDVSMSSTRLRDVGQKLESRFEAATLPSGRSIQVMPGQGIPGNGIQRNISGQLKNAGNRLEPSHLAEFDELELDRYTEFHQLARGLSEGISDMTTLSTEMEAIIRECEGVFARENRLSTTFQDRLMKARLVPLSAMTPRLHRSAWAVALKQHKEIEFLLEGEYTEVDRTVFEEIAGPLLHLVRNAVNHAIETPEVRSAKGKPPVGQIKLSAAYEGNQVVITVRDDGTGIDPEQVRNAAIAHGVIPPHQVLSQSDVIDLIFRPGFSTAEVLSEESGRGVGLDVVRDSVSRLRGTLEVESTPGQGTAFTMKFPTSLAIQSAMMVRVGDQQFAIPTLVVEAIGRLDNFKRSTLGGRPAILVRNEPYILNQLAQYLSLPLAASIDEKAPVLLVRTGHIKVALVVDEIKGKMDVVMKNLGPHLRNVHGVAGGTVLGNGRVVLILELIQLLSTQPRTMRSVVEARAASRESGMISTLESMARPGTGPLADPRSVAVTMSPPPAAAPVAVERGKHVLVVDDSPSVRRVVSNMLKQHGWEVQMARDGVEALEMITHQAPAAVLLDIEMPRMDGYELMATVRAQEQYRTLPIVILTSRAAAKHQQRAMQLGANSYVVKPYQDEELINMLNSLVYGTTKH
jgi:chemotaxis protein histidine kinase CheA/ActR/RegA family two-component response regulator